MGDRWTLLGSWEWYRVVKWLCATAAERRAAVSPDEAVWRLALNSRLEVPSVFREIQHALASPGGTWHLSDDQVLEAFKQQILSGRLLVLSPESMRAASRPDDSAQRPGEPFPQAAPGDNLFAFGGGLLGGPAPRPAPLAAPPPPPPPAVLPPRLPSKVLTIRWDTQEAYCSDPVSFSGTTQEYPDGSAIQANVHKSGGPTLVSPQTTTKSNAFQKTWAITEILPEKQGAAYAKELLVLATADGVDTPQPLKLRFIPDARRLDYSQGRARFGMSVEAYAVKLEAKLDYVKGWASEVVKLDSAVPPGAGGVIAGFTWPGYRWMRQGRTSRQFWDGTAWVPMPAGFTLTDRNHFSVGFYKSGTTFTCQYGGTWPDTFTEWNIQDAANQRQIQSWAQNLETTWSGKFDLHRKECKSAERRCCRYTIRTTAAFAEQTAFSAGMLILADGNIRSNDSLWFLGEPRVAVAAHEFGHHLGNGDEYVGAQSVDPSLNGDGAVNGIDTDSIMGQNLTKVKVRHFRIVCSHMARVIQNETGKSYTYEAVAP